MMYLIPIANFMNILIGKYCNSFDITIEHLGPNKVPIHFDLQSSLDEIFNIYLDELTNSTSNDLNAKSDEMKNLENTEKRNKNEFKVKDSHYKHKNSRNLFKRNVINDYLSNMSNNASNKNLQLLNKESIDDIALYDEQLKQFNLTDVDLEQNIDVLEQQILEELLAALLNVDTVEVLNYVLMQEFHTNLCDSFVIPRKYCI